MSRRPAAGILVGLGLLSMVACSLPGEVTVEPPPVPAHVRMGGTLRVGIATPTAVDPAQAYDRDGELVVQAMCDPLVEIDLETGEPVAGLSRHIIPESRGVGATVTLKGDLTFPDGSPAVVEDVRTSLSRVASDLLATPLAAEIKSIAGFELVHGDVPVEDEDDPARRILQGTTQVTKTVVTITGSSPDAELMARLARPWSAVVPAEIGGRADFADQPVCVGPYQLEGPWSPADREIVLVRNPSYTSGNEVYTGGGMGYPDRIVFRVYRSESDALRGWRRGEVDIARLPASELGGPVAGATVTTAPTPAVEYIGLPMDFPPFDRQEVRVALSMALDRQRLIDDLGRRDRVVAGGLLPSTMPGPVRDQQACRDHVPASADLRSGRQLLTEAGISLSGAQLNFYVNDEPGSGNAELVEAVAGQWASAFGIEPEIVAVDWEAYLDIARTGRGFDGPFRTSWASPVASPNAWFGPLLLSTAIGDTNLTRFSEPLIDRSYVESILEETDTTVRASNESRLYEHVCQSMPLIPVWEGTQSFVVRDNVASASGELQRRISGDLAIRELYVIE